MPALPGEHYCENHQGNHSHYAKENCTVCQQVKLLDLAVAWILEDANECWTANDIQKELRSRARYKKWP